jgi:predicted PurR-regulated permease PerM
MSDRADQLSAARILTVAAAFVIVVAGMKAASDIVVPLLLAVFISVIVAPLFLWLRRKRVPAAVALLLMILILVAIGILSAGLLRQSLVSFSQDLPKYQTRLEEQTQGIWEWLEAKGVDTPDHSVSEAINPRVVMLYLGTAANTLSGVLANAFMILLVVVFILLEVAILPAKVQALPGMSHGTWSRLQEIVEEIRRYMSLKTVTSLITGVLVTLLLMALRIDYPILLGLLAFVLNYVPNIGSIVAAIPGFLLAFIQYGPGSAAIVAVGYAVINVMVGNVLEPRLMGRGLGVSPLIILISMIFWGWVLGPVGMLLSVPLTMTAKIAMDASTDTKWIALLMGSRPEGSKEDRS